MRQILLLALIVALGYLISQLFFPRHHKPREAERRAATVVTEEMVRDPVCHLYLPRSEAIRRKVRGQEHFFCSPGCLDKFLAGRR
jgi:YHS domain-containing protein